MKILVFEPGKKPEVRKIENSLEATQKVVGGCIEQYAPQTNNVMLTNYVIIMNEEGVIHNLPLQQITSDWFEFSVDMVIAGTFFIVLESVNEYGEYIWVSLTDADVNELLANVKVELI